MFVARSATIAIVSLLVAHSVASAQNSVGSTPVPVISGSGTAEIARQPDTLRVTVEVQARGSNITEALESLEKRRQRALDLLAKLEATKSSIHFSEPRLIMGQSQQQQQMEQYLQQQLRARGREVKLPEVTRVMRQLSAEWSLQAESGDQLLITIADLTKKIRAADLGGTKEADKLTPEEEELMEELEGLRQQMGMRGDGAEPGQPSFIFMSKISEQQRTAAIKKAFQKAEKEATDLAQATGTRLGPLWTLTVHDAQAGQAVSAYGGWEYNAYGRRVYNQPDLGLADGEFAAVGLEPGEVTYTVQLWAAFQLESGQ